MKIYEVYPNCKRNLTHGKMCVENKIIEKYNLRAFKRKLSTLGTSRFVRIEKYQYESAITS